MIKNLGIKSNCCFQRFGSSSNLPFQTIEKLHNLHFFSLHLYVEVLFHINITCEVSQQSPHGISNNFDIKEGSDFGFESKKYLLT